MTTPTPTPKQRLIEAVNKHIELAKSDIEYFTKEEDFQEVKESKNTIRTCEYFIRLIEEILE